MVCVSERETYKDERNCGRIEKRRKTNRKKELKRLKKNEKKIMIRTYVEMTAIERKTTKLVAG